MGKTYPLTVEGNMGLVHMVARRYFNSLIHNLNEYDDLISAGTLGLIHALERFDPKRGYRFSSFAVTCIWGFMMRDNRNLFMEKYKAINSRYDVPYFTHSLYTTSNSGAGDDEPMESLRMVKGADDGGAFVQQLDDASEEEYFQSVVEVVLSLADKRERQIVIMLFGLDGKGTRTLREIGETMGISHERCRQLKERLFTRCREMIPPATMEAA